MGYRSYMITFHGSMAAILWSCILFGMLPPSMAIGSRCQAKLDAACAQDAECVAALATKRLVATKVGPGVWRCVANNGRFCTRNALALEQALLCGGRKNQAVSIQRPGVIDNGGKPYVIVNLLGEEEWKNIEQLSAPKLPTWMREPRIFCSAIARKRLPTSSALCDSILDNATVSRCSQDSRGILQRALQRSGSVAASACAPLKIFLPTAHSAPVMFKPGLERWMDAHAQLGPANEFVRRFRGIRPKGGGNFLDNGCSLDGRQLQYMLAKLPGALAVGLQVERDFPYVMEQRCERCAMVKLLKAEGEGLPFRDGAFDGVLSVNVLEHAINAAQYVRESVRVMRAGGIFYATWCPTFGAHNGHHLNQGRGRGMQRMHKSVENYTDALVPPYTHLALARSQAASILGDAIGNTPAMIEQMLQFMYEDMHISRLGMHVVKDELDSLAAADVIRVNNFVCDRPKEFEPSARLQRLILARHPELRAMDLNALGCWFSVTKL